MVSLLLMSSVPTSAWGDIYCYVDENNVRHFSNTKKSKNYKRFLSDSVIKPSSRSKGEQNRYDDIILMASKQFQVDGSLIRAVIKAESDFDHLAVSTRGAKGLMQLMPETASQLKVRNPFDPKENVIGGTRYLSDLLKRFNHDKTLALAAYNAGPTEVETRQGVPPFPETRTFIQRVLSYYQSYRMENK